MTPRGLAALLVAVSVPLTPLELARSSLSHGMSLDYAEQLTALGPRVTGTAVYRRAAEWSVEQFRATGIARVALDPFTIERGWERVSARARLVAPEDRPLHAASLGWMPSTADGGVEGEVVALERFALDQLPDARALSGRIVLMPDGEPPGNAAAAAATRRALAGALRAAGVLAMLSSDGDAGNQLSARGFEFTAAIGVLPAAQIGRDDVQLIRSLMTRGPVRLSLELINRITPVAVAVDNVIAEWPGRDRAAEWVVVGAHLDSWDFGPGAQDNATGVAMVLEAARAIAALKTPPRRSIRFALWAGEEQGQLGSTAWVRAHAADLDGIVAYLNSDAGTGRQIGWTSPGRPDLIRALRPLAGGVLAELGSATFDDSLRYAFQSDGAPFILAGIPTLDLNADDTVYEEIHHKAADTMARVDARALAAGAATVAATVYAIADAPGRVAPRQRPKGKLVEK